MKELVKYWIDEYNWRNQEVALNQHNHYQGNIDGLNIHFLHEKGKGPNPMPLFMMHGYPWSFTMLLRILPMLTDPGAHGGNPEDAFTVVVPSIIGFGFSEYPMETGFGFQHHPQKYDKLITEGIGIHLNCLFPRLGDEREPEDKDPNILRGLGMKWAPLKPTDPDMLWYWKNVERY